MREDKKQYLLFIYSTLSKDSVVLRDIPLQLAPLSSSPYIKYNFVDSSLICNFESTLPFSDLREFISLALDELVDQYFLIEHTNNMSVFMENSRKLNLFDLNSDNQIHDKPEKLSDKPGEEELYYIMDYFLNASMMQIKPEDMDSLMNDDDEDPLISKLKLKKDIRLSKPTLDSLLEKIKEKGLGSLTKYEKQLLNEYAEN